MPRNFSLEKPGPFKKLLNAKACAAGWSVASLPWPGWLLRSRPPFLKVTSLCILALKHCARSRNCHWIGLSRDRSLCLHLIDYARNGSRPDTQLTLKWLRSETNCMVSGAVNPLNQRKYKYYFVETLYRWFCEN